MTRSKSGISADNPAKAQIFCLDKDDWSIDVQFNPTEFKYSRSVPWTKGDTIMQGAWGRLQYTHSENDTLSTTLLLDQSEFSDDWRGFEADSSASLDQLESDTRKQKSRQNERTILPAVMKLHRLTMPVRFGDRVRPPTAAFIWGGFQFQGVVTKLDVSFKLFDQHGQPRRGEIALEMQGRALSSAASIEDLLNGTYKPEKHKSRYSQRAASAERAEILDRLD